MRFRPAAVVLALGILVACDETGSIERTSLNSTDSTPSVELPLLREITADEVARLGIGRLNGRLMANGDIVLWDEDAPTAFLLSSDGSTVRSLLKRGNGPNESPGRLIFSFGSDTLVAVGDPPFSPPGALVFGDTSVVRRVRPPQAHSSQWQFVLKIDSRHWLLKRGPGFLINPQIPRTTAVVPETTVFAVWRESGRTVEDSVPLYELKPVVTAWLNTYPTRSSRFPFGLDAFPFAPVTIPIVRHGALALVHQQSGEIVQYDTLGLITSRDTLRLPPGVIQQERWETAMAASLKSASSALDTSRIRARYEPSIRPQVVPRFRRLFPVADGSVWVESFGLEAGEHDRRYTMISERGKVVHTIRLPGNRTALQFSGDRVLVKVIDRDDDAESLELLSIANRPGRILPQ